METWACEDASLSPGCHACLCRSFFTAEARLYCPHTLAALRTALDGEAEGKRQLVSEVAGRISGARDQLRKLQDAVGRMRGGRPQATSSAEVERAQKRAKDLDEDLMQEEVRTRYSLSLLNGKAVSGSPAS